MRRDIPIIVFKIKGTIGSYICRACYKSPSDGIHSVIPRCMSIFTRRCDRDATVLFNNKEHEIIMSVDGTCDIKQYNNGNCLANENCNNCQTKINAIIQYKQNNSLP